MGQDMAAYLDTLLSLQSPKTPFPDEEIFIVYHQITELYFKLSLHECKQIAEHPALTVQFFTDRVKRINAYFNALVSSFEVMVNGMKKSSSSNSVCHFYQPAVSSPGGTNWQKYLPPRFQKRIFYPFLWTREQVEEWGKSWVLSVLKTLHS